MPRQVYRWGVSGYISIQILDDRTSNPMFYNMASEDLQRIRDTEIGRQLLDQIEAARPTLRTVTGNNRNAETAAVTFAGGVNVTIIPMQISYVQSGFSLNFAPGTIERTLQPSAMPHHNPQTPFWQAGLGCTTEAADTAAASNGQGTTAIVRYSNAQVPVEGAGITPSFVILAHELMHALHMLTGTVDVRGGEEDRARGTGAYAQEAMSENALRRELGMQPRQ